MKYICIRELQAFVTFVLESNYALYIYYVIKGSQVFKKLLIH